MKRRGSAFSSRRTIISCALVSSWSSIALGAAFECPDDVPPFPKPAHVLSTKVDKKGGNSSNASTTGFLNSLARASDAPRPE